jgi:hypothetical protein
MTREDGRQHQHLSSQGRNYCNWSLTATVYMSNNDEAWCAGGRTEMVLVQGLASIGVQSVIRDQRDPPKL